MGAPSLSIPPKSPSLAITRPCVRLEHHDLVGLIARDPEVVVLVNDEAVGSAAGAVDEDLRRAGLERRAAHRYLHDRVLRGVGDEQRRLLVVERQAIRADRQAAASLA